MLLGRTCTNCNNNFLTLWARCSNFLGVGGGGGGVLLGIVCMLYNMIGCMAVVCDAVLCYKGCDAVLCCKDYDAVL